MPIDRHSFARSVTRWVGVALQTVAALWMLGWLQGNDPDCELETSIMAQIRMCDAQTLASGTAYPLIHLAAILALFAIGQVCWRLASPAQRTDPPKP